MSRTKQCLFASLALILWCGPARADEPKAVTVPFELLKTQHMTVQIKINGKGPYRVIFDTGAPVTLINNKVAKEAGVFPKDFKRPAFAFFGSMGQFKMQTLEVGDVKLENVNTMVMDHPTVSAISSVLGPIEGIVGFNFFAKYRMTLDYQKKTMTFVPNDFQPQDLMETLMKTLMTGQGLDTKKVLVPAGLLGLKVAKEAGDDEPGVTVKTVFADSPAARAGFKEGDRLLTLNHRWTDSVADCFTAIGRLTPGTPVPAVIQRDNKEMTLKVEIKRGL